MEKMRGCTSAAATSFNKLIASSATTGRVLNVCCRPPETQIRGLRFVGCGGGEDFASSRWDLFPLVCLGRNSIRSVASSSTKSSEFQDELEPIIEGRPYLLDQDNLRMVHIKIQLRKECQFGEQFFVVGAQSELGLWNPSDALPMTWSDDHLWTAELDVPVAKPVQFKFIQRQINGEFLWQPGQDRVFHTWETSNIISVFEDWENAGAQQITEEQVIDNKNEEPHDYASSVAFSNHETVDIVADNISPHTNPDMDRVMIETDRITSWMESSAEISSNQAVDENIISDTVRDEVANFDIGLIAGEGVIENKQVPIFVPGVNSCSTTPADDVTVKEEQEKVELHISNIWINIKPEEPELGKKQEQAKGHSEIAPTIVEHLNELASENDEEFNGHPDQDLESAFSDCQGNNESGPGDNDITWGHKTLKRLLSNLGFQ